MAVPVFAKPDQASRRRFDDEVDKLRGDESGV